MKKILFSLLALAFLPALLHANGDPVISYSAHIHSSLADVLYILDEPSVGLHPRDIERLKRSVLRLRDAGNTVLLVEHHPEMIRIADHIVDLGPGPGIDGGRIMFQALQTMGWSGKVWFNRWD